MYMQLSNVSIEVLVYKVSGRIIVGALVCAEDLSFGKTLLLGVKKCFNFCETVSAEHNCFLKSSTRLLGRHFVPREKSLISSEKREISWAICHGTRGKLCMCFWEDILRNSKPWEMCPSVVNGANFLKPLARFSTFSRSALRDDWPSCVLAVSVLVLLFGTLHFPYDVCHFYLRFHHRHNTDRERCGR